jgi:hypothetical protein
MGNGMHTDPPPSLEDIALEMYGGSDSDLAHGGVRESREKKVMCETGRTARYPLAGHVSTWKLGSLEYLTST